jgi:putative FmdB family regulatory protein
MPIYAYRCADCGHTKDVLQKLADAPLTVCPACGAATFAKQITAAGFQLKGSGWYATDFKNNGNAKPAAKLAADGAAPAVASDGAGAGKSDAAAAPAPAQPAAAAPAPAADPAR